MRNVNVSTIMLLLLSSIVWFTNIIQYGFNGKQYDLFFAKCKDFLADFINVVGYSAYRDPYNCIAYTGLGEKGYPPLNYIITYLFSRLVDIRVYYTQNRFLDMYKEPQFLIIYIIFLFGLLLLLHELMYSFKNGTKWNKLLFSIAVLLSAPVLFTIERGNLLLLTIGCVTFYIFNYDSDNAVYKEIALISLGIAFALKIAPVFLGILLLLNKQWKDAVRAAFYGCLFFFLPFLFFKGGLANIDLMIRNIQLQLENYTSASGCTMRACLLHIGILDETVDEIIISRIFAVVACVFVGLSYKSSRLIQVTLSTLVVIMLPGHSEYYNLIYLIPSFVLFLNKKEFNMTDVIISVAYIIIFSVYRFKGYLARFDYHCSLLILLVYCMCNICNDWFVCKKINDHMIDRKRWT